VAPSLDQKFKLPKARQIVKVEKLFLLSIPVWASLAVDLLELFLTFIPFPTSFSFWGGHLPYGQDLDYISILLSDLLYSSNYYNP